MNLGTSIKITSILGNIEKKTGGRSLINIEDDSALLGLVNIPEKYDEDYVLGQINKFKRCGVKINHLIVEDTYILIQLNVKKKE